jgi:hypothetical protein
MLGQLEAAGVLTAIRYSLVALRIASKARAGYVGIRNDINIEGPGFHAGCESFAAISGADCYKNLMIYQPRLYRTVYINARSVLIWINSKS